MNKQEPSKQHLELKNVSLTWFQSTDGEMHNIQAAHPLVFDAWISQFVEDIQNVDRSKWRTHHRWNIINAVLTEGLLVIVHLESCDKLERPPEAASEEKASVSASETGSTKDV